MGMAPENKQTNYQFKQEDQHILPNMRCKNLVAFSFGCIYQMDESLELCIEAWADGGN